MVSKHWWCTVEVQEDVRCCNEITPLVEAFIYSWVTNGVLKHQHEQPDECMSVYTGLYYTISGITFMVSIIHFIYVIIYCSVSFSSWLLIILNWASVDRRWLTSCTRAGKLEAPYWRTEQRRWAVSEKCDQQHSGDSWVWVRGSMCAQTISFSSEFWRLQSRYCLLSWVRWWRKAHPFLRSHNLSSSWVFCFWSRNACLSALNSHISNSQAQNHTCV